MDVKTNAETRGFRRLLSRLFLYGDIKASYVHNAHYHQRCEKRALNPPFTSFYSLADNSFSISLLRKNPSLPGFIRKPAAVLSFLISLYSLLVKIGKVAK